MVRMMLTIKTLQVEAIRQHGMRDYPGECCGALLGRAKGDRKEVDETVPLKNLRHDPALAQSLLPLDDLERETERNRFLIDPLDQLRLEKEARRSGLDVLGYYHSHPDHAARPSNYDRKYAWPGYSYVIVAVELGTATQLTSWVLAEDRATFNTEQIEVSR
jgi:proteasome lid subunit RPN8/RPN11